MDDVNVPEIFAIGGPKGAGKSTTAMVLVPESLGIQQFVNADLIARGLSPFAPAGSAIEAGRLMLKRMRDLRARRETFAFESTLASRNHARFLSEAQDAGYLVHVIYIWLGNVELALSRVAIRVRQGGHDVPAETIRRRYWRGLSNFFRIYRPLADTWTLCDNTDDELVIVACGERAGIETVRIPQRYRIILDQANDPTTR